ncbi:MAG: hypothetical protein QXO71_00025 [Candidatus Jordarchaeaceae archaeon]
MSKTQLVLATLLTIALLALIIEPTVGAGVASPYMAYPIGPWFGLFGWFGWLFPQFPYPI